MVATSQVLDEYREVWTTEWSLTDLRRFLDERVGGLAPLRLSVILLDQELRWLDSRPIAISQYIEHLPELRRQPTSLLELSIAQERLRETIQQRDTPTDQFAPASVGGVGLQFFGEKRDPITRLLDHDDYETVVADQVALPVHIPLLTDFAGLGGGGPASRSAEEEAEWDAEQGFSDQTSLLFSGLPAPPNPAVEWLRRAGPRVLEWAPQIAAGVCGALLLVLGTWLAWSLMTPHMEGRVTGERRSDNGLEMPLIWCQPGWSTLGSPDGEVGRHTNEAQVEVNFTGGYWIGQSEVTQDHYQKIMYANPSHFSPTGGGRQAVRNQKTGNLPVENVSPEEIREFCRRLTAIERQAKRLPADWEYTLPTEAQWEHAARAGGRLTYGDNNRLARERAQYDQPETGTPRPVGPDAESQPNAWGLYDMLGNVAEICRDSYREELTSGVDPLSDAPEDRVVIRGGSWKSSMHNCRPAWRDHWGRKHRAEWLGFRVVLVKSPPEVVAQR